MVRKSKVITVPKNEETDDEIIEKRFRMTLKKGDRVITTGHGRTKNWGNVVGIVTKRRGDKVFVQWEGTSFSIEDEMDIKEVRPDDGVKINKK